MVKIRAIEIYHPKKIVENEKYLKEKDERRKHFLEDVLGRKKRYEDDNISTLGMLTKVSKKILHKNNLIGRDIDMLIVGTATPEYFIPPTATILANSLGLPKHAVSYDMNVCCMTMTYMLEQTYFLMKANQKLKRVLLVSYDGIRHLTNKDSSFYGYFGDLACAIIIENNEEYERDYFIDVKHLSYYENCLATSLPQEGSSKSYRTKDFSNFNYEAENNTSRIDKTFITIPQVLKENNLTIDDISMFCLSQNAYSITKKIREFVNIPKEKSLYVGDKYGYTAGNSPILVLYEAIKQGKVQRGDKVFLWTVGAGEQQIFLIIEY